MCCWSEGLDPTREGKQVDLGGKESCVRAR